MTCTKYEDKINGQDFTAFVCDMGIKRVSKEDYDRLLKGNKSLIDKNKKLEAENKKLRELVRGANYIISSIGLNTSCGMQNRIGVWLEALK